MSENEERDEERTFLERVRDETEANMYISLLEFCNWFL